MNNLNSFFSSFFTHANEPSSGLYAHFKLFEAFVYGGLLYFVWIWTGILTGHTEVFHAGGLANYLPVSFLFGSITPYLNALLISVLLACGYFRWKPKITLSLALLLIHLHYVARYSLGKLPHDTVFLGMALMGFVLGVWFFEKPAERIKFVFTFILFFMGFGYTISGIVKIIGTMIISPWSIWADGYHLWMWIISRQTSMVSATGIYSLNFLQDLALQSWFLATAMLSYGLIAELCGFLLWFDRTRWIIATALIGLHLGIGVVMSLFFVPFILQIVVTSYRWDLPLNKPPLPFEFFKKLT